MKIQTIDPSYHFAISKIFSTSLLTKINNPIEENSIRELLHECKLYPRNKKWDLHNALQIAYDYLKGNYRCEYVYKNEIANQLLLKYHNDNSAAFLREITSINSIADIVIVNGNTIAYEIKSDLDGFDRLNTQIESYKPLYDLVYVVTYPAAVKTIEGKIDSSIGIIVLQDDGSLITKKEALSNTKLFDPKKAIHTLRNTELIASYKKNIGEIPYMGATFIHKFCYNWFMELDRNSAHSIFNECLKSRKPTNHQFKLIKNSPLALKMIFLSKSLSRKYCYQVMEKFDIFD